MDAADLLCIICPAQPRFSDVSHLLTHVSSKAHLSNNFKVQVRSHQDDAAATLLKEYNDWFTANKLQTLLSDRINSKDDRKKKRKSQTMPDDDDYPAPPPKRHRRVKKAVTGPAVDNDILNFLDPRLMETQLDAGNDNQHFKPSCFSRFVTPTTSVPTKALRTTHDSPEVILTSFITTGGLTDGAADDDHELAVASNIAFPVTPKPTRTRYRKGRPSMISTNKRTDSFPEQENHSGTSNEADVTEKERSDEMTRLKGILWPGMDIFDSATHQMRRKRNQKKDGTVLRLMEITSLLTEPTEKIFSPEGDLLKNREITGNVDEDSPLKGETPVPKQRRSRSRREVLCQIDANRPLGKRKGKKASLVCTIPAQFDDAGSPRRSDRLTGLHQSYTEDDDFQLSVQAFAKRPRSGFSIFAESDHQDKENFKDRTPRHRLAQDTLTPARLVLDQQSNVSKNLGQKGDDEIAQGKENIEPILNQHGSVDMNSWNSPLAKRSGMNQPNYPPEFFFVDDEDDQDCKIAFHVNPLFAPSSKMGMGLYGDGSYDEGSASNNGWPNVPRAQSSEATISEEDHQELARLYLAGGTE